MQRTWPILLIALLLISGCDTQTRDVSAGAFPTSTPFQPVTNASDPLYAGSAPTPLSLPTFTPVPSPTTEVILPTTIPSPTNTSLPQVINPLTGLPAPDPSLLNRRALAIKVANYPRYIRPQSGLTLADQVFEYYIEGGLTRFIAIFYSNNSEWVGPVRSGRFFDENIQRMYQSYIVFKYADPRVLTYFQKTDFAKFLVVPSVGQTTYGPCPPFLLLPERKIEVYNNSYFNMLLWPACVQKYNLPSDAPSYRTDMFGAGYVPPINLAGTLMYTYYSVDDYNYWQYVPETGQYIRFQETGDTRNNHPEKYAPLTDRVNNNEQVHAANVVYIFAYHTFANPYDQEDEVYHIDLSSSGEAYVFRDGQGIVAKWHRNYLNQPLYLTDATGAPILLKPGITFYEILGSNSYVDQGDGQWDFHHATP